MEDIKANEEIKHQEIKNEDNQESANNDNSEVKISLESDNSDHQNDKSEKAPDANVTQSFDEEGKAGIQYPHFEVTVDNLKDYLGAPRFQKERLYQNNPPGVSTGLAYTSMGGSVLFLEAIFEDWNNEGEGEDSDANVKSHNSDQEEEGQDKDKDNKKKKPN